MEKKLGYISIKILTRKREFLKFDRLFDDCLNLAED